MSEKQDYYDTLGVAKNASDADIKKAYKRLAGKYHPDRNPGDETAEQKFKQAKEAYEILSDSRKRSAYDQFGHAGVDPSMGGHPGGGGGFGGGFGDVNDIFGDIFGDIFTGGRGGGGRPAQQRGDDLAYQVELSLEDVLKGIEKQIDIPLMTKCEPCKGEGAKPGSKPTECSTCHGQGQIHIQQGFLAIQQTCPACHGQGKVISDPCSSCHGEGRVRKQSHFSVKIPAGVKQGDRMRLSGKGDAGHRGGPAGDLYIQIRVKPHEIFERNGDDLHCDVPVDFVTTALGGEIDVPTLQGQVKLKIPAETQSGSTFRLRGKGIQSARSSKAGDLLCKIRTETPVKLNTEQKQLLRKFQEGLQKNSKRHSPRADHWFSGVKKFFQAAK